jgi:hypothetical protein
MSASDPTTRRGTIGRGAKISPWLWWMGQAHQHRPAEGLLHAYRDGGANARGLEEDEEDLACKLGQSFTTQ